MSDNFNQIPINVSNSTSRQTNINNNNNNNNNIKSQSTYHTSKLIENETDAEASDLEHLDFKMESPKNEKTYFYNNNNSNNDDNDLVNRENLKSRNRKSSKTPVADLIQTNNVDVKQPQPQIQPQQQQQLQPQQQQQSQSQSQSNGRHRHETNLLKELMQLSIKKDKIEKALAATGYQNSTEAINWIMKHSKDALLNQDSVIATRDYILVICPVGRLANQITTFLHQSRLKCGNNEAHFNNLLPFMKLTPFFKMADSDVINLHKSFDLIFKPNQYIPDQTDLALLNSENINIKKLNRISEINIDLHVSTQMILLYPDIDTENLIKDIVGSFSRIASKLIKTDYEIVPYSKQLHLTLAYNFDAEHKRSLEELAIQHIDYRAKSEWEIRLYSRDSRADSKYTYKVITTYKPKAHNELYLKPNDYIFSAPINLLGNTGSVKSMDNFIRGVSFSTGESGFFPSKHVERAAESDTWKLHKSHQFVNNSNNVLANKPQNVQQNPNLYQQQLQQRTASIIEKSRNSVINIDTKTIAQLANAFYSENSWMQKRFQANPHRSLQNSGSLRFFFARHGERIDLAFGPQWIEQAFDRNGKYRRINLNMPSDLPTRGVKREFIGDSPLTEIGKFQAKLTGEALGNEGYKIHYCYASPALRCIQTAHQVLQAQGLDKVVKIRIEPSLFEFLGWYDKGLPTFLTTEPLIQFGYNIDVNYKPLLPVDRLQTDESYTDYYQRSYNITKYLSNLHQNEGANILGVGHAGTLEVCTRQICGFPIRQYSEFNATIRKVPYLGMCLLEKDASSQIFEIQQAVIPPLAHTANFNFDPASLKM